MSGPRSVAEILAAWKAGGPDPALVTELARLVNNRIERLEHAVEELADAVLHGGGDLHNLEMLRELSAGEWAEFERLVHEERS